MNEPPLSDNASGDASDDAQRAAAAEQLRPIHRPVPSRFGRVAGTLFARCVLLPLTWVMGLFGKWPRAMVRAINRMFSEGDTFTPSEHDAVVCSFFKSGTNWTMQMTLQVAWRGQADFEHIHDLVPWVDLPSRAAHFSAPVTDVLWQACPTRFRVIKTHLPFGRIAYNASGKYIWVVRDPKDVFVSSYHFLRSVVFGPLMPSPREWLEVFLSEDSFCGSWAEHLDCGWRARERDNVLFMTFEEMKRDQGAAVSRIATLLGIDLTAQAHRRVMERSSYAYMKAHGHQFDSIGMAPPWADARGSMVRRGRAGGSDEMLTPAEQRRIDDYWRAELKTLGSDFPYDRYFG